MGEPETLGIGSLEANGLAPGRRGLRDHLGARHRDDTALIVGGANRPLP